MVRIKGANKADKQNIALAKKANRADAISRKTQVAKRGDQAPEAQPTKAAKSKAADKLFKDADAAVGLTADQEEKRLSRAVMGY